MNELETKDNINLQMSKRVILEIGDIDPSLTHQYLIGGMRIPVQSQNFLPKNFPARCAGVKRVQKLREKESNDYSAMRLL